MSDTETSTDSDTSESSYDSAKSTLSEEEALRPSSSEEDVLTQESSDDEVVLHFEEIFSKDQLLNTVSDEEREQLQRTDGICAGLALAWLQLVVRNEQAPGRSWPDVMFSQQLQEYYVDYEVPNGKLPGMGYMEKLDHMQFLDAQEALQYLWNNSGSYLVLARPLENARYGHAFAYSDQDSYPYGYVMNQNTGCNYVYTYDGLLAVFRLDNLLRVWEYHDDGIILNVLRVGKADESSESEEDEEAEEGESDSHQYYAGDTEGTHSRRVVCRAPFI